MIFARRVESIAGQVGRNLLPVADELRRAGLVTQAHLLDLVSQRLSRLAFEIPSAENPYHRASEDLQRSARGIIDVADQCHQVGMSPLARRLRDEAQAIVGLAVDAMTDTQPIPLPIPRKPRGTS
jgi:hypothetical protein